MIPAQLESRTQFTLDLLAQAAHRHPPHEVGGKLARRLLGADDLQAGLAFRLKGLSNEQLQGFVVGHLRAVHLMIENGVGNGAEIELQLRQTQSEVPPAVTLVEHRLLGIDRPAFDVHTGAKHLAHQRRIAVGVLKLHVVAWIGLVDREDLEHVPVVLFNRLLTCWALQSRGGGLTAYMLAALGPAAGRLPNRPSSCPA